MRAVHRDFRHSFFTIRDNVLTVGKSAKGEQRVAGPHPHKVKLLKGAGVGCEKQGSGELRRGTLAVKRALQEVRHNQRWARTKKELKFSVTNVFLLFIYKRCPGCEYPHSVYVNIRFVMIPNF